MKRQVRKIARRFGLTISGAPTLGDFLKSRNVDLVIDVGANVGQFARSLRDEGYRGNICSFEPVKSVFASLTDSMKEDGKWTGRNYALGDNNTQATINITNDTVFSSLRPQTGVAGAFGSKSQVARTEEIEIRTLDSIFDELGGKSVFLKIDTQGFEEAVLKGASHSLPRIGGLQLELPIDKLYANVWDAAEALQKLEKIGFVPAQMRPSSHRPNDPVCWTEIDCVFRRLN